MVRRSFPVLVMVLSLVLAASGVVWAAEPPDDIPDGMEWDATEQRLIGHDELLERDAQALADRFDWSLEYAKARVLTSERADKAMARVQRLPSFAGSYWDNEDGGAITFMFKDEVPAGALDEVRELALVPVEAKVAEYSMRDLERFQRQANKILRKTPGVGDWTTALDPSRQLVVASVVVDDPKLSRSIEAKVGRRVPEGVVDLEFKVQTSATRPRQDVCLRVSGSEPGWTKAIARDITAGTAAVDGAGVDCADAEWSSKPRRGACLRVVGSGELETRAIARQVAAGKARVVGAGTACGADPVPLIAAPDTDVTNVREISWQRIEVEPGGRTLHVYYRDGPFDCRGLDRLEVSSSDAGLDVQVFSGYRSDSISCLAIAVPWVAIVTLDEPVVLGGGD